MLFCFFGLEAGAFCDTLGELDCNVVGRGVSDHFMISSANSKSRLLFVCLFFASTITFANFAATLFSPHVLKIKLDT